MAYNYAAAYGASYGQYAAQNATLNVQQQTTATAYPYGQTAAAAYGAAASASTTSTQSAATQGYGSTASSTTTAAGAYNYAYNYNYNAGNSTYNTAAAQQSTSNLQPFQQSWYSNSTPASTPTTQQSGATTQTATVQQQAYGQYLQQYQQQQQQQMNAYQQYANAGNVTANSTTMGKTDTQQQQKPTWPMYNQMQQQRPQQTAPAANTNDPTKTGWGNYQQPKLEAQQPTDNQQKSTGIVYRTPMKYTTDTQQYSGSNMMQNYNSNQSYKSPALANAGQSQYSSAPTNYNQGFGGANQSYGNNQSMGGNNMQQRQALPQPQSQQYGQRNQNNVSGFGHNQGFQQNQPGQNVGGNFNMQNNRGGYNASPGNMNIRGQQQAAIRPLMTQRSPMGGGSNAGNFGNMGPPRDGASIPPFPRAWHGQEQSGPRGFNKDHKERWGGPGPRGPSGFNHNQQQQQQQNRQMYSNNSRNPKGSNRELWSPAQKSGPKPLLSIEIKSPTIKKEEGEKIDKDKIPEIKSFLYAWLGARHSRPTYDIRQIGERPDIIFRCDLRVEKYSFVGVGKATSKKEAQTQAARRFAEYLVRVGEIQNSELPSKQQSGTMSDDLEADIGDVNEQNVPPVNVPPRRARKDGDDFRNRNRKAGRGGMGPNNRGRGGRRGNPGPNWGGALLPSPDMPSEIQPLMSVPVAPWGGPGGLMGPPMGPPPPRMMGGPHPPPLMDYGPPFWDEGWVRPPMGMGPMPMGPPMPMRPPPPFMRRNQNDFWRRRDIEERMMDISRGPGADWAHPEDMFISQMIRNQQEGERRQRGQRGAPLLELPGGPGNWDGVPPQARPIVTSDDRHVMAKHSEIYPQEGELKHLHRVVNTVEQALKLLSDKFVDEDHPKEVEKANDDEESKTEEENKDDKEKDNDKENAEEKDAASEEGDKKETEPAKEEKRAKIKILKRPKKTPKQVDTRPRVLCGVNRVGPLAKGLLIAKDQHVKLVLLCGEIPTVKLLDRIMQHLEEKLEEVDPELKVLVERREEDAGFCIKTHDDADSAVEVSIVLTATSLRSPPEQKVPKKADEKASETKVPEATDDEKMKEDEEESTKEDGDIKEESVAKEPAAEPDPVGMLNKSKMLEALACLRHTHWFQAKACMLQSCVVLTRILRDLQKRDPEWTAISEWALEVLIYNCLTSSDEQMGPGDACRRFFEVVAGGILLPDLPGINDPCERSPQQDILDCMTIQQREDLTRIAQRCLRKLAFREIHLILGIDKLPSRENHHPFQRAHQKTQEEKKKATEEKVAEPNNQRKRRFEANSSDSVAESPKRSLTDEEDTDTQQNLAELSISDENSEGKLALDEDAEESGKSPGKEPEAAMDVSDLGPELTKEEEDALLEEDDKMDT